MKLHLSLRINLAALLMVVSTSAFAQEEAVVFEEEIQETPLVEVHLPEDTYLPYKERRGTHGAYFGVNYEGVDLKNYISTLDNKTYFQVFGTDPVPLLHVSIDYKYNTQIGAFSIGVDYGSGELSGSQTGTSRTLKLTRYGVGVKFTADTILDEPYVAPYVGINFWQMGISETSPTDSFSATTQMGYNYTVGALLQLDWIDYDSSKEGTFNWGLENTFIDVYATQYAKTSAAEDPNTATDLLYGAGLRLEF